MINAHDIKYFHFPYRIIKKLSYEQSLNCYYTFLYSTNVHF